MIEISLGFVGSALAAGMFTFLAPCTLPLVPAYLAFIGGIKQTDLIDPGKMRIARWSIVKNGLFFCFGFSVVFILFGLLAGLLGSYIGQFRGLLSQIGGLFIIVFGIMMLGLFKFTSLTKSWHWSTPKIFTPGTSFSAFLIGVTFALGWTPCVGPILASILLLASTSTTVWSGGLLLAIFAFGLSIPFMLTAILYAKASTLITNSAPVLQGISYVGGAFLVLIGGLLLTENFGLTVEYGYRVFYFFGLEGLFDRL